MIPSLRFRRSSFELPLARGSKRVIPRDVAVVPLIARLVVLLIARLVARHRRPTQMPDRSFGYDQGMFRKLRHIPFLRFIAILQVALLARRHFSKLNSGDRRRLRELVMRGISLNQAERSELFRLLNKFEPRAFAAATANAFSPVPLHRRFAGRHR
jgi:hypothetical protein